MGLVHVINLKGELPKGLGEIRAAQEAGQRVLDENRGPGERPDNRSAEPVSAPNPFRGRTGHSRTDRVARSTCRDLLASAERPWNVLECIHDLSIG
jgi:hypothetical protein